MSAVLIEFQRQQQQAWSLIRTIIKSVTTYLLVAVFCTVALISFPNNSWAGSQPEMSESSSLVDAEATQSISEGTDIAAEKIDQFAQAYLQVLQLLSDREPELPAAESSAEALKIQQSIESEAISLIQSTGLTVPEYMQILSLVSQDEALQDKVLGRMDDTAEEA
ncbi:MAG: DUF4168 domain-containing protein [Cyanobacteria bacterium J06632_3]